MAAGLASVGLGLALFRGLDIHTPYWYILLAVIPLVSGMALAMSPMTAAIMSAVPARRAGSGSAMNDATRELGAALGVAVMGSIAASRYASSLSRIAAIPEASRAQARTSLADALAAAHRLPPSVGQRLTAGADRAFIDGIHFAVITGAALALIAAATVLRYLPHHVEHDGASSVPIDTAGTSAEVEPRVAIGALQDPVGAMAMADANGSGSDGRLEALPGPALTTMGLPAQQTTTPCS